jgi:hypothetical protein
MKILILENLLSILWNAIDYKNDEFLFDMIFSKTNII